MNLALLARPLVFVVRHFRFFNLALLVLYSTFLYSRNCIVFIQPRAAVYHTTFTFFGLSVIFVHEVSLVQLCMWKSSTSS